MDEFLADSYQNNNDGIEEEQEIEFESEETPFDAEKIRIEQRMLSLKYTKELIDSNFLNLNPDFQRNIVWRDNKRKSLLIESLMLRIPIPAFYFYEDEDSFLNVIDGLQRLNTINEFLDGKFKLKNLQYLQETCGGKTFYGLDNKYKTRIYMTQFSVNVIDARTPTQVKYDLFRRINTGGVPLNSQEIRNSIAKPQVRDFLSRLAKSEEFLRATDNGVNDTRMAAQELILRYMAFYMAYDFSYSELHYMKSNLELFIDQAFEKINKMGKNELEYLENNFLIAMNNSFKLFGKCSFRKYDQNDFNINIRRKKRLLNKSLFTSLSVLLTNYSSGILDKVGEGEALDKLTELLSNDEQFSNCLTVGTNSAQNVQYNFLKVRTMLEELLE